MSDRMTSALARCARDLEAAIAHLDAATGRLELAGFTFADWIRTINAMRYRLDLLTHQFRGVEPPEEPES